MTSKSSFVALGAMALIVLAGPALAQSIDLSPVQTLLQGIVDAITGPLGIVIGTLALIGVFLSWLFGILDFRLEFCGGWRTPPVYRAGRGLAPSLRAKRSGEGRCKRPQSCGVWQRPRARRWSGSRRGRSGWGKAN